VECRRDLSTPTVSERRKGRDLFSTPKIFSFRAEDGVSRCLCWWRCIALRGYSRLLLIGGKEVEETMGWKMSVALLMLMLAGCAVMLVQGVDRHKFRTCAKTDFCRRFRGYRPAEPFRVLPGAPRETGDNAIEVNLARKGEKGPLALSMAAYKGGVLRVRVMESLQDSSMPPRFEPSDVLLPADRLRPVRMNIESDSGEELMIESDDGLVRVYVEKNPFRIKVEDPVDGRVLVEMNGKDMFHFEQRSETKEHVYQSGKANAQDEVTDSRKIIDWGEDGKPIYEDGSIGDDGLSTENSAENDIQNKGPDAPEAFGGHTDNRPHGATSIGLDTIFPGCKHVYGIPEHTAPFSLKTTSGESGGYNEPYRNYNLDVFEYEIDEPMALYGHIPVTVGHSKEGTVSVFWNNPSETFVEVLNDENTKDKRVHWMSESGVVDVMVMVGPTARDVFQQYASMTGTTDIPPMFSLGYHQCRWNYRDEADVREVNANFEKYDFPYDVIWLDIEHTDGKRYFTWDKNKFPTPKEMQANIQHFGRKMVTIVDPHIKRDGNYYIHREAERNGFYVKDKDGNQDFKGWCWPGDSSYLDFTSPKVRSWYADQFAYNRYEGSTEILFTWNDMNEPSVFNGPEVSMTKEALSLDGIEHREWHNLYGFYHHGATAEGLIRRNGDQQKRPFVLSRSFFAGSQRHGAIWTGDNAAEWSHLKVASEMILSFGVAGLPFVGADVGGFFGNPSTELLERWYQAAAFQPFFRAHAHIDTKRREPWLFGEEVLRRIRRTVSIRYSLLPLWYTLFREHETTGVPVMRPLWFLSPGDEATFEVGDEWLVGNDLLVKPVTDEGATSVNAYFPKNTAWFDFYEPHHRITGGQHLSVDAPIDKIPVFIRAGSIISRKMRVRRSTKSMRDDPYTLYVAVESESKSASGTLYIDDEETFAYKKGAFCDVEFAFGEDGLLISKSACGKGFEREINVERIVVLGLERAPSSVSLHGSKEKIGSKFDAVSKKFTIRKPSEIFFQVPFQLQLAL